MSSCKNKTLSGPRKLIWRRKKINA